DQEGQAVSGRKQRHDSSQGPKLDEEALLTWAPEIVTALLPAGTTWRDEGDERRYAHQGGLYLNLKSGKWCNFGTQTGGSCTVGLIAYLKQCDQATAVEWAETWQAGHPGLGSLIGVGETDEDGDSPVNAAADRVDAQRVLDRCTPVADSRAETY